MKKMPTRAKLTEKEFERKFVDSIIQIRITINQDMMIFGDSFIEFTDRKIEVLKPEQVITQYEFEFCPTCKKKHGKKRRI